MKNKKLLKNFILAALFAAMSATISYFIKIPLPNGYIHPGDAVIYLCACLLPAPVAMFSAGIGGALADFFGGYPLYMLPSFVVKALIVLCFSNRTKKLLCKRNVTGTVFAGIITVTLYYITDVFVTAISTSANFAEFTERLGKASLWIVSAYYAPANLIQAVVSAIIFVLVALALDKSKIKSLLRK